MFKVMLTELAILYHIVFLSQVMFRMTAPTALNSFMTCTLKPLYWLINRQCLFKVNMLSHLHDKLSVRKAIGWNRTYYWSISPGGHCLEQYPGTPLSLHYSDVIMGAMASQLTSLTIVYLTVYSGADQRKKAKLRVTGLCAGNSPVTGEFPAQVASNVGNVSIGWRHHIKITSYMKIG